MFDPAIIGWLSAAAVFSLASVRLRVLSLDGALAASALGLTVVFLAGAVWLAPLFFFFGTSLLIGKLSRRGPLAAGDRKQTRPRDAMQVLSNGLPYAAAMSWAAIFHQHAGLYLLIPIAVATSDTWSSEVGMAIRGSTVNIIGFKPMEPGRSGGVSLAGSAAGMVGASCVALFVLVMPVTEAASCPSIALITLFGFSGMLLDSALGSLLQARYAALGNTLSDQGEDLAGGFRWMTNDVVNLLSNAIITAGAVWLLG